MVSRAGLTAIQSGRNVILKNERTPKEHEAFMAHVRAHRPSILPEIQAKAAELEELLLRHNPFSLLGVLTYSELAIDPETYKEYAHEGREAVVEYAALLYMKHPFSIGLPTPIDGHVLEDIRQRIKEVLDLTVAHYACELADGEADGPPAENQWLRLMTIVTELFVRNPGYQHHAEEMLRGLFDPFSDWLMANLGFDVRDVLSIEHALSGVRRQKIRALREKAHSAKTRILEAVAEHQGEGGSSEDDWGPFVAQLAALPERELEHRAEYAATCWAMTFGDDCHTFTAAEVAAAGGPPLDRAEACMEFFASEFGSTPSDFCMLSPTHDLRSRPFMVHDGSFMLPNPHLLLWAIKPRLEEALKASSNSGSQGGGRVWSRYDKARASYLEQQTVSLLQGALRHSKGYTNLHYESESDGELKPGEVDGIVIYDQTVFIIQAKAGAMTPPARRGGIRRIQTDLRKLVGEAQQQAILARDYILSNKVAEFTTKEGQRVAIPRRRVRRILMVTPTLECMSIFTATLHETSGTGALRNDDMPWSVSLLDLRVICDINEFPAQLVHFLLRRSRLNELQLVRAHDELDWFGHYLEDGLYFEDFRDGEVDRVALQSFTTAFDDYYLHELGLKQTPVAKPTQPMPARLREVVRELEAWHPPGYSEVLCYLLDPDDESREEFWKHFDDVRSKALDDGRPHDATLVFSTSRLMLSCLATHSSLAERALKEYVAFTRKRHTKEASGRWLVLVTSPDTPSLVHSWYLQ